MENNKRLLVFNCHESWVYQLGILCHPLDIIVGLKGSYKKTWDEQMRPVLPNCRLISLEQARRCRENYYCIITHNIADLLDIKQRNDPKLLVIHSTIEGRKIEENSRVDPAAMRQSLKEYVELAGVAVVAVSQLKGRSWGFSDDIVGFTAESKDYPPFTGELACGLRVSNFISSRKDILLWDFHEKAFSGIDVRLVGHNPDMAGVEAAANWDELKQILQSHRFFIHTAEPNLEDGYNMATVEAMAAGMPILGNRHPGSPVKHGVNGFLSDDPAELGGYARDLLADRQMAIEMGKESQRIAAERFSAAKFKDGFLCSIERARKISQCRI